MKHQPDLKELRRAAAELRADNEPRKLNGFCEPRLSPADERTIVELAHRRNHQAMRADLQKSLATITSELAFIEANIGRVTPGDHRAAIKFARRALVMLNRTLAK